MGQIAGYNNAMNVIYGQAAPKVPDLQEALIGRFSSAFSALAETLDNQKEPEKLTIEPSRKEPAITIDCFLCWANCRGRTNEIGPIHSAS